MYDEQEEQLSKRKRKFKISIKLNQDNSDDSDDQLGASSEYHVSSIYSYCNLIAFSKKANND